MEGMPSFDEVVDDLTRIVDSCRADRSPLGIFPAMYRTVTTTVGEGIERGAFDDPARVERLVVVFAGLYVEAFDMMRSGGRPAEAWDLAFRFARSGRGSICQHLLLGMNAHINLDLGIATASSPSATLRPCASVSCCATACRPCTSPTGWSPGASARTPPARSMRWGP
jgi:hypothetical protein